MPAHRGRPEKPALSPQTVDTITAEAEREMPWFTGVKDQDIDTLYARVGFVLSPSVEGRAAGTRFQPMIDFRPVDHYVASCSFERSRAAGIATALSLGTPVPSLTIDWGVVKRRAFEVLSKFWRNLQQVVCDYADQQIGSPADAKKSGLTAGLAAVLVGAGLAAGVVGAIAAIVLAIVLRAGLKTVCQEWGTLPSPSG